jgi:hypothetical protein
MKTEFVSYNQAIQLRLLGIDEICFTHYWGEQFLNENIGGWMKNSNTQYIMAPLKQQVFRWFREKHNILGSIYSNASGYLFEWHDSIGGTHRGWSEYEGANDSGCWDSYEEAESACIDKLIELVKNN